ncbi:tectonic-2-like [Dendronephthya gigantea]|uniref:tectonic-2-like n=1 Tax=Dendronephthya gigantea TaxID=151771 RepID=UPI001069132D|nr:tectonic-2-like [Dendronephthya gigantea]
MKGFISSIFSRLVPFLLVEICRAQPVVDIITSSYPNNILQVPVYKRSGNLDVKLSEVPQNHQVEITCGALSSDIGLTNISFITEIIQRGQQDGSVSFSINAAGRAVQVRCSGQSIGGTQFQRASSFGQTSYIQVTRRPTVSLCLDVVNITPSPMAVKKVEISFSESILNDPVILNCSVISSLRASSNPLKVTFTAKTVPVSTRKTNISYILESEGDPVVVACWASSKSTTTPADNLQYTRNTSQGDTAVFMYQIQQATFVPASITSLGRTTVARTVSYLVLESPATNLTQFYCTFHNASQRIASLCAGSFPLRSSLELSSIRVELVTTNMTFEVGDFYKPLIVQINGSSTHRVQRLLDVTCCRDADPKYFMLSTSLSLWIDVYPSMPFKWENISDKSQTTFYSVFDPHCLCDLEVDLCDARCCCDKDCSSFEKQSFPCAPGYFGDASEPTIFEYGCQETWSNGDNYRALFCVVTDNNPFLGLLYDSPPTFAGDSVQFDSLQAGAPKYEYRKNEIRSLVENDVNKNGYRDSVVIKTDRAVLTLPQEIGTNACARYAPVVFLRDFSTWCSSEFSEIMCSKKSSWNALEYLVPSTARSCLTSPQVLNLNSTANSSSVPTHVQYFCQKDSTAFVTEVGNDWDLKSGSFNTQQGSGGESHDSRCAFDDGVSKPPAPIFDENSKRCSNVVLKVAYDFYWKGGKIVQLRARIALGDITASTGNVIVAQRFSVKYTHLATVDATRLPFIQPVVEERSGNPGYIRGKKVIAKANQTTQGHVSLWSTSSTGLCAEAKTSDLTFGENSHTGCLLRLSLNDFINCTLLRNTVLERQRNLVGASFVARRGNATFNKTDDWVPLLSDTAIQPPNATVNQSSSATTVEQTAGSCDEIPSNLRYEILIRQTGIYYGTPQMEIVGARVRYLSRIWKFQCSSGKCYVCNVSRTENGNETRCTDIIQSFAVTSSVDFITLSDDNKTRMKRSQDASPICYQDACPEEVFYPLLTSYDGESREVAIAYGLMLVAIVLLITSVSTSLLQNLKSLTIG